MGLGPVGSIIFSDGPRLGPARQIDGCWAAVRPGPSHFRSFTAKPGPAHQFFKILGPARPTAIFRSDRPGAAGPDHRPIGAQNCISRGWLRSSTQKKALKSQEKYMQRVAMI